MPILRKLWLVLLLSLPLAPAGAETLLIEAIDGEPANDATGTPRPDRGMSMGAVAAMYGDPLQQLTPVGHPPITRWVYDTYTVYFEHQTVLRTVMHREPVNP